jgi:hypothetical protein
MPYFPANQPVQNYTAPIRNRGPMHSFWAALRTVGDKIELTVTIVTREHYYHGR